jgi:DNA repair protein RadD
MMRLRPYQLVAVEQLRTRIAAGDRRIVVALPTGGGKTVVATHIVAGARNRGRRVLFVAHRRELISQAYAKFVCEMPHDDVGVIMASDTRRNPVARVQVASIDTLRSRHRPEADIVIIDECHRALSKSYSDLRAHYPNAVHLGLTATPYRADGRGLGEAYDSIVTVATPAQLIADGFLVEPRVFTVPSSDLPNLSGVRIRNGDYDAAQLAIATDHEGLVGNIVDHWLRRAGNARTVVFASSVAHSKHIVSRFVAAGVSAEHLDGTTPTVERDAILHRLERGETRVVSNMGVLCEGWDQPAVKCCILARPTTSTGLYLQQAGRILRPYNGEPAFVLDHAGCVLDHGLPQDEREFTLDAKRKRMKLIGASCKTCPECFAIVASNAAVCPSCGAMFTSDDVERMNKTAETEGELVEVRPASQIEKRAVWDELCTVAESRGYAPGWAAHQFKSRFRTWPPNTFPRPQSGPSSSTPEERAEYIAELKLEAARRGYRAGWVQARYRARFNSSPEDIFQ